MCSPDLAMQELNDTHSKTRVALRCKERQFKKILRRIYDIYFPSKFKPVALGIYQVKFLSHT
jgi:hypothetical protein